MRPPFSKPDTSPTPSVPAAILPGPSVPPSSAFSSATPEPRAAVPETPQPALRSFALILARCESAATLLGWRKEIYAGPKTPPRCRHPPPYGGRHPGCGARRAPGTGQMCPVIPLPDPVTHLVCTTPNQRRGTMCPASAPHYNRRMPADWNAGLYDASHAFVWEFGRDLLALLAPQPGERILDVGCGTGHLTAEIARSGAQVLGIDRSAAMIAQARDNFPGARVRNPGCLRAALPRRIRRHLLQCRAALGPAARSRRRRAWLARSNPAAAWSCEFGGHGNIQIFVEAAYRALGHLASKIPSASTPGITRASPNTPPSWNAAASRSPSPTSSTAPPRCRMASAAWRPGSACSAAASWSRSRPPTSRIPPPRRRIRRAPPAPRRQLVRRLPPPAHRRS